MHPPAVITYSTVMHWEKPAEPAPPRTLLAIGIAGAAGAIALPETSSGIGFFIVAIVCAIVAWRAMGRLKPWTIVWGTLSLSLVAVTVFRDAGWLFDACLLGAIAAASLAVTGGRSIWGMLLGSVTIVLGSVLALPWVVRGVGALRRKTTRKTLRLTNSLLISAALLVVFVPLLAGADAAFAKILANIVPEVDGDFTARTVFTFVLVAVGTAGASLVITAPPELPDEGRPASRLSVMEWAMPVGILVILFAGFAAVQFTALFGGIDYVLDTADVSFATYARSGFWQLLAVTVLTLGVVAAVIRWAPRRTSNDRAWLRGLLGGLSLLVLVIVASALGRMWTYQQAYGFTVLRLSVEAFELWLGLVYVMILVAGVRLEARWLPRAIIGSALAGLLVFAVLNPEKLIAQHNVQRLDATGHIDVEYLSRLSADAAPALAKLPLQHRACALSGADIRMADRSWQSWNVSRATARPILATNPGRCY
ncbi:DUF4173 domain-containing protein [Kibdelosporangium philippinense]|uniref:DUF4173 domain-containing protein n=1 Tax=Kibdelosporangium philippinense TaxID=211113 RepID=A0ABS8ZQ68_9PSEU|nr:DUF4173 domain-containing protein [Kibdelosporangium philippinense]MCE7009860.1 DUF4173 domain-containing protein [Kibdelosporangium philippinense]